MAQLPSDAVAYVAHAAVESDEHGFLNLDFDSNKYSSINAAHLTLTTHSSECNPLHKELDRVNNYFQELFDKIKSLQDNNEHLTEQITDIQASLGMLLQGIRNPNRTD